MVTHTAVRYPASERPRLRGLLERLGLRAPVLLGASLPALQRAAGGLGIRYGTALSIRSAIERLPADPAALSRLIAAARAQTSTAPAGEPQP